MNEIKQDSKLLNLNYFIPHYVLPKMKNSKSEISENNAVQSFYLELNHLNELPLISRENARRIIPVRACTFLLDGDVLFLVR